MSRNPILTDRAFEQAGSTRTGASPADEWNAAQSAGAGAATAWGTQQATPPPYAPAGAGPVTAGRTMSLGGVAAATLLMFAVLLVGGGLGWSFVDLGQEVAVRAADGTVTTQFPDATIGNPLIFFGSMIGAFVLAIATAFMPKAARFTALPYAFLEGIVLGVISAFFGAMYSGIVAQAVLATLGVFLTMLVLYGLRILRATPRFVKGVIAATFGIMFMYLGVFIANLFGVAEGFWTSGSPLGILISVVVVVVAALNLILDFDFIEQGSKAGLPRYMDWYAGFGLMVTLVWLYLEMLRLLARLRQ
jgi:uncharacterized YccA/Bax inhibitor family protein